METYNQYIDLINQYLSNLLSDESRIAFESKLENDPEFKTIYEEHMVFINGLQRVQVKADIQKGQRSYYTEKWVKISGFSILALGLMVMIYTLVFKTSEIEPTQNNNINVITIDSVSTQKDNNDVSVAISEEKPDSTKTTSQHVVSYTTTTIQEKFGGISETNIDIKKKAQMVKINVQNDTTITCKEGTVLNISKGSFINPNTGKTVTGVIDLNVTEYYKLSDILMANLSTVSNGKQLETGGMIYIEASQGTTTLELKDNRSLEILFPTPQKKSGMQLFNGEWQENNINWSLTNTTDLEVIDIDEAHIHVPFNVVEVVPTFPGCESEDNDIRKQCTTAAISKFISRKFNTDVALGLGLTGRQRILSMFKIDEDGNITFIQSRAAHPRLSEEADRVISLLPKMSPGLQRGNPVTVPYSLPINFEIEGEVDQMPLRRNTMTTIDTVRTSTSLVQVNDIIVRPTEMDTVYTTRRGMVELIREVMHDKDFLVDSLFIQKWQTYEKQKLIRKLGRLDNERYILRKPLFEMDDTKFKILEDDSITRGGHVIRFPWNETQVPTTTQIMTIVPKQQFSAGGEIVSVEEFETRLGDEADTSISTSDATYYALSTTKLGWINCDRFINGRTKRIKYKLKIKNTDGASVNMVFKSYNSILPSWHTNGVYDFKTVGLDEEVILVAIKRTNGKLYYDTIETKTEVNPQLDFKFKEVSIEELKEELEKLNSIFN